MLDQFINLYPNIIGLGVWAMFPIFFFLLCQIANLSLSKISAFSVSVYFIFLFNYLGLPILYFGLDSYRSVNIDSLEYIFLSWIFVVIGLILMLLGAFLVSLVLDKFLPSSNSHEHYSFNNSIYKFPLIRAFFFLVAIYTLYLYISKLGIENIAIIALYNSLGGESVNVARSEMVNAFDGNYHWYKFFMRDILFLISISFFLDWIISKKRQFLQFFAISSVILLFVLIMTTEKMPMLEYFVSLILAYMMIKHNKKIQFKASLAWGLLLMIFVFITYFFLMNDQSYDYLLTISGSLSRIFTGALEAFYYQIEFYYDNKILHGTGLPNPGGIFSFEPFPVTQYIWYLEHGDISGASGSMPAIFIAEGLINFGIAGLILFSLIAGILLRCSDLIFDDIGNTASLCAVYTVLIMHLKNLSISSLSNYFFDPFLLILIILLYLIKYFYKSDNNLIREN